MLTVRMHHRRVSPGSWLGILVGFVLFTGWVRPALAQNITSISPSPVIAGGPAFTLTINGSGFVNTHQVQWNNQTRNGQPVCKPTTFVNSNLLRAQISAEDIAQPTPVGGWNVALRSNNCGSQVTGRVVAGVNPAPVISDLEPTSAVAGGLAFELTVNGSGFLPTVQNATGSVIRWQGENRATTFVNSTQLTCSISASNVAAVRPARVSVFNPSPGGGETASTFAVTGPLIFSRLTGPGTSQYSSFAVVNMHPTNSAVLTFTAYNTLGSTIEGANVNNRRQIPLAPREQLTRFDVEVFGDGLVRSNTVGWFKVDSTSSKVAAFFLMSNDGLTLLDGADVSYRTLDSLILPEIENRGFTQVSVVNPNSASTSVTIELINSEGNQRVAPVTRMLNANGTILEAFTNLFPGVTPNSSDYLRVNSSSGIVAFEALGVGTAHVRGLNGQDARAGSTILYSPQYVIGGGYQSILSLINLDSRPGNVMLEFIGDNGSPISAPRNMPMPATGKVHITDQNLFVNAGSTPTEGYLRITSNGPRLVGSILFGDPGLNVFASALPLVSTLQTSIVFGQVASNETFFTGISILNPNDAAVNATIEVRDENGNLIGRRTETIPARQRISDLLTQFVPQLVGQNRRRGYISVETDRGVASFALYGTNNLSVLSAVPPQVVP